MWSALSQTTTHEPLSAPLTTILRSEARSLNALHPSADKLLCDGSSRSFVKSYFSNWLKIISKLA